MEPEVIKRISIVNPMGKGEQEQVIRSSLQRVLSLIDNIHVHKAHLDVAGVYLNWDLRSQQMFGYSGEEVIDKMHVSNMFACIEDFDHVWRIVRVHKKFSGDIAFCRKDGYIIVVRLAVDKEYDEQGVFKGYLISAVDRSGERKLEHQLESHLIMLAGN